MEMIQWSHPYDPFNLLYFSNFYFILLGIELVLGTKVISADVRRKTLLTGTGETISYKTLIIATGAQVLDLFVLLFIFCSKFNSS